MAAGMQCWSASGQLNFDSTINTTRVLGTVNTGTVDGHIDVPASVSGTIWAAINYTDQTGLTLNNPYQIVVTPNLSVSGHRISWSFGNGVGEDTVEFIRMLFGDLAEDADLPTYKNIGANIIYGVM